MPPLDPYRKDSQGVHPQLQIRKPFLYALLVTALLIIIAGSYYSYIQYKVTPVVESVPGRVMVSPREFLPQGSILLTLVPKGGTYAGIYEYDFATKSLSPALVSTTSSHLTATYASPDTIVLATNEGIQESFKNSPLFQIAEYNKNTNTLTSLTKTNVFFKRHPQWSSALNMLVYSGKKDKTDILGKTEDFMIYTRSAGGFEQEFAVGSLPVLTPDEKSVVALRKDGLYMISLENRQESRIWPLIGTAWMNVQFAVSPKGTYIAWSNPTL